MRVRWALLVSVLVVSACGIAKDPNAGLPPVQTGLPTPTRALTTVTPTPSEADLVKQAQAAYKMAFDEFERLSWAGGADQPSARMLEVEQGLYLEQDMALLRDQKKRGYRVEGRPAASKSRSAPGRTKADADPRFTLEVCEDRRGSNLIEAGFPPDPGRLAGGFVYTKVVHGRLMLVDVDTKEVETCGW